MRIYLVIADEWVYHPRFVRDVVQGCRRAGWTVVGMTLVAAPVRSWRKAWTACQRDLVFFGVWDGMRLGLRHLWYRMTDRWAGARRPSFHEVAVRHQVPIRAVRDVNAEDHLAHIRSLAPDVIVSSNGQKFSSALLALPRLACLNRHSALLPKYRGVWPVFWALLHGEPSIGVSVHVMTPEYDAGDIVAQEAIPVAPADTLASLYAKAFARSGPVVLEALARLARDPQAVAKRYDPMEASYFSHPTPEAVQRFRQRYRMV